MTITVLMIMLPGVLSNNRPATFVSSPSGRGIGDMVLMRAIVVFMPVVVLMFNVTACRW